MSASNTCRTPISWLRLERHHLGEPSGDGVAIAEHLRSCSECAALLERIANDDRELPALVGRPPTPLRPAWYARHRALSVASGLAIAAVVLLAIGRRPEAPGDDETSGARLKGSDLSFALVREDEAVITEAGGSYRDGDRFKAVVTCPPGTRGSFDVVVFEGTATSFPLSPSVGLACGNAVPLPGAFRVTGREPMTVCLVWQPDGGIDRETIRRTPPDRLAHALCKTLAPNP